MKKVRQILAIFLVFVSFTIFFYYFHGLNNLNAWNLSAQIDNLPKHFKSLVDSVSGKETKTKFVRFMCHSYCGGYADRLKGVVAAHMWARMTKRRFEIDIQHPCFLQNVLEPNEIDWRMESNSMIEAKTRNLTQVVIHTIDNQNFRKNLSNVNLLELYEDIDIIIIRNNLDWILHFSQNRFLRERIKELGYKVFKFKMPYIFKSVYRSLFKLSPHLMPRYIDFVKRAQLRDETKLVCVQVRKYYAKRENSKLFWQFVNRTILNVKNLKFKIFITTDMHDVHQEGVELFGEKYVVTFNGHFEHMDKIDVTLTDCERIEKVILDFHALQNCDYAVISQSGFGKLGVFNRDHPEKNLFVFKNHNNEKEFVKMSMADLIKFDYFF